jgi:hypothetical protein
MESPIAPKSQIVLVKEYSYSYKTFDSNHIIMEMKKLNGLKVYEVECTYILKKKGNVVFQPEIKLLFNNKEQSLAPFEPICFFNFQSIQ